MRPATPDEATPDEAVERVLVGPEDGEEARLRAAAFEDLTGLHAGRGARQRNQLGLWRENPALLASLPPFTHPDDASTLVIEHVWYRLRKA